MPIVSAAHIVGHAQADGRRYVVERHTDGSGAEHLREYLADAGVDYVAVRDVHAQQIADALAEAEAQALIDSGA